MKWTVVLPQPNNQVQLCRDLVKFLASKELIYCGRPAYPCICSDKNVLRVTISYTQHEGGHTVSRTWLGEPIYSFLISGKDNFFQLIWNEQYTVYFSTFSWQKNKGKTTDKNRLFQTNLIYQSKCLLDLFAYFYYFNSLHAG